MKQILKCIEGIGIKREDKVLIQLWGNSRDLDYLHAFEEESKKHSDYITVYHHSKAGYMSQFDEDDVVERIDFKPFEENDVVIDLMAESIAPTPDFSKKAIGNYRVFMGEMFRRLMQSSTFVQLRLPTNEMADSLGLDAKTYVEVLNRGLDVDYKEIKSTGEQMIKQISNSQEFLIETGNEKLVVRVDDRPWHNDCGNGDIPCGEVYTPCIETSANGRILIETTKLMGQTFDNIVLTFEDGILIESSEPGFLKLLIEMNEDSRRVGELGFGTNSGLSNLINCPVLDEKIKGTAHIALGRNTMFGGKNEGEIHHDLVFRPTRIVLDGKDLIL